MVGWGLDDNRPEVQHDRELIPRIPPTGVQVAIQGEGSVLRARAAVAAGKKSVRDNDTAYGKGEASEGCPKINEAKVERGALRRSHHGNSHHPPPARV